jgi:ribosomal protein S18 acetylase RimI-like enzyme
VESEVRTLQQEQAAEPTTVEEGEVVEQVTEEVVIPDPITRPTRKDVTAFDDNTIEESRLDGIVSAIADKQIENKKLTPFQARVAEKNQSRVDDMVSLKTKPERLADLEATIELESKRKLGEVNFRLKDDAVVQEEVTITPTDSSNPSFEKESMQTFNVDGGVLEIGKVKGFDAFQILNLKVDENKRRQGKAEALLKEAIKYTDGQLTGMASNDAAVALNYKLGMRAISSSKIKIDESKDLSLEETLSKRKEKSEDDSILMKATKINNETERTVIKEVEEELTLKLSLRR